MDLQITKENNDQLFNLCDLDSREVLLLLDSFYLEYRDCLFPLFKKELTFGLEIEFEGCLMEDIKQKMEDIQMNTWVTKRERSLNSGGEINSPILMDRPDTWSQLRTVCTLLKKQDAFVSENCGGHFHIGSSFFGNNVEDWLTFIKCWILFEKVLFRFSFGETSKARRPICKFASPIASLLKEWFLSDNFHLETTDCATLIDKLKKITNQRSALNFQNIKMPAFFNQEKNTLEFRFPNGSIEEVIWQNNINVFGKILYAIKQRKLDIGYLDYLCLHCVPPTDLKEYGKIYLQEAFLFADMFFDNNLDKLYFLRQYLKNDYKNTYEERQKTFIMR